VGLARKAGSSPASGDTFETLTLGRTDGINHLVLREHVTDRHLAFKETVSKVHFLGGGTTIDLNFHQVCFLLTKLDQLDVSVSQNADNSTELLDAFQFGVLTVATVGLVLGETLGVLCEGLLLGVVPVFVEAAFDLIVQMLSPDGGKGTEALRGLDVSNKTNNAQWWGLDHGDGFNNFLLVDLGARLVRLTHDVSHTGLVAHKASKVAWFGLIVLGELAYASSVMVGSFSGKEPQGSVAWSLKLTV